MEFYYQTSNSINLNIYINGILEDADFSSPNYLVKLTVTRLSDNTKIVDDQWATRLEVGKYYYTLSTANNGQLGRYKIVWSYTIDGTVNNKNEFYDVVVPYANAQEVKDHYIPELDQVSNDDLYRKEKLARRIVNNICNQRFDFELETTKIVQGNNSHVLVLPRRLYSLTSVKINNTEDITSSLELIDEFHLKPIGSSVPMTYYDIKSDITYNSSFFKRGVLYYVKGSWGWESVPEDVRLATTMLVYDYFNDETLLRRHGVYQSAIGDTQYTFNNDLWFTTGNYDVDLLLAAYTEPGVRLV